MGKPMEGNEGFSPSWASGGVGGEKEHLDAPDGGSSTQAAPVHPQTDQARVEWECVAPKGCAGQVLGDCMHPRASPTHPLPWQGTLWVLLMIPNGCHP